MEQAKEMFSNSGEVTDILVDFLQHTFSSIGNSKLWIIAAILFVICVIVFVTLSRMESMKNVSSMRSEENFSNLVFF
jgi:hypothetical protein